MGRTVYLLENEQLLATIEGPSILIQRPFKAPQRIPIRLINRVYVVGKINLSSDFILKLAVNRIPLILAENSGSDRAVMMPFNHKLPKFFKEQRVILENKKNIDKYIKWVDVYRTYIQLQVVKRFYSNLKYKNDIGEGDYKILISKLLPQNNRYLVLVKKTVNYLMRGLLIENINKAGLDPHIGAYFRRVNFGFVLDMSYLLEAKEDEQVILFFKQKNYHRFFIYNPNKFGNKEKIELSKEGYRNIIHRFENLKTMLDNCINKIIDDFFCLIRELQS